MKPISASHFTRMMKSEARLHVNWVLGSSFSGAQSGGCRTGRIDHSPMFRKRDCAMSILRRNFLSVRGYGLRTDEPRQGRNAATVV